MARITNSGIQPEDYNTLLDKSITRFELLANNTIVRDNSSILFNILSAGASANAENEQYVQYAFASNDIYKASGQSLDIILNNSEFKRIQGQVQTIAVMLEIDTSNPKIIPAGVILQNNAGVQYKTTDEGSPTNTTINAISLTKAKDEIPSNEYFTILTPTLGLRAVKYISTLSFGFSEETDESFRNRYLGSINDVSISYLEVLKNKILTIPTITHCELFENRSNSTLDINVGNPSKPIVLQPHQVYIVIEGQSDGTIAQLFYNATIGIDTFNKNDGKTLNNTTSILGNNFIAYYNNVELLKIKFKIKLIDNAVYNGLLNKSKITEALSLYNFKIGESLNIQELNCYLLEAGGLGILEIKASFKDVDDYKNNLYCDVDSKFIIENKDIDIVIDVIDI